MQWMMWFALAAFMGSILYTIIAVGKDTGGTDSKTDMAKAITNVTIINAVMILVLAGTAYYYINANQLAERPYILVMLHVNLFLSVLSVSVSSLQQLAVASTKA